VKYICICAFSKVKGYYCTILVAGLVHVIIIMYACIHLEL